MSNFVEISVLKQKKESPTQKLGANKAVKCREDGVTRYAAGYTVFFFMQSAVSVSVMRFASVPSSFGFPARQEGSPVPPP